MDMSKISIGKNSPEEVNVIIEIPANAGPIKYEFDKDAGALIVDRIMPTAFSYPGNYGFVPHTLSGDVLVYTNFPLQAGSVISVKPIGVLMTEDEKGTDEKILAVPGNKIDPFFAKVNSYKDLPEIVVDKITHFFENYKKLEKGKWVKVLEWRDEKAAKEIITAAIDRAK
jgi:inorganic pyrophosphatase